jgi:hypothetical protein
MKKPTKTTKPTMPDLIKGVPVTHGPSAPERMSILLWGPAGSGKTTWAATAPGNKLWLSFGDNEHVPVSRRDDVFVANLSGKSHEEIFRETKGDNPFGLDSYLANNEAIATVVCDSLTAISYKGLQESVANKVGASRRDGFTPTMEAPGMSAYGGRNANVIEVMTGLLRVTAKYGVHIVFTAHEDDPVLTKDGAIDYIKVALGGKIVNETTYRMSEVWHFRQLTHGEREREVYIRPYNQRRPMKTRMFDTTGPALFPVRYDPYKPDDAPGQVTIASFYDQWIANGKNRIPVPTGKVKS